MLGFGPLASLPLADDGAPSGSATSAIVEAIALADAQTALLLAVGNVTEAVALSDAQTGLLTAVGAVAEAVALSDVQTASLTVAASVAEAVALSDAQTATLTVAGAVTEAVALADASTGLLTAVGAGSEAIALSDAQTGLLLAVGNVAEALALADTVDASVVSGSTSVITEAMALADTVDATVIPGNLAVQRDADGDFFRSAGAIDQYWRAKAEAWIHDKLEAAQEAATKPKKTRKRVAQEILAASDMAMLEWPAFAPHVDALQSIAHWLQAPAPDYTALEAAIAAQIEILTARIRRQKRDLEAILLLVA